ncbi:hypothetical protein Pmani_027450 [Petrolisthes manimaculis]|uniref:Uncharacterized protein n=1 Tax=Petrolisthes manimaculis TaxID=1843537 RepID=A0AAE1TVR3_9EUCA|nr:hypothetical protein Pmani_027450 [Petrolisthes manimaculis]
MRRDHGGRMEEASIRQKAPTRPSLPPSLQNITRRLDEGVISDHLDQLPHPLTPAYVLCIDPTLRWLEEEENEEEKKEKKGGEKGEKRRRKKEKKEENEDEKKGGE